MQSTSSTSLWGTPSDVPPWVKSQQGLVRVSGFMQDVPHLIETYDQEPATTLEGALYFHKGDKTIYVYSNNAWHKIGEQLKSETGEVKTEIYKGYHTDGNYTSLLKEGYQTVMSASVPELLNGQSVLFEGTITTKEETIATGEKFSAKFHYHLSRKMDGTFLHPTEPLFFYFTDPPPYTKIRVNTYDHDEGLAVFELSIPGASEAQPHISFLVLTSTIIG